MLVGNYRVTVPDIEELDQLRMRGESIGEGCIHYLSEMVGCPHVLDPYLTPLGSHPQGQWIRMR